MLGIFGGLWIGAPANDRIRLMPDYRFSLIVRVAAPSDDDILAAADALCAQGRTDASLRGHAEGMELLFERADESLQSAISSAVSDVERAGFPVVRAEMERESLSA